MFKQVELTLRNSGDEERDVQAAYYIEPVLGINRQHARHTAARWEDGALLLRNPFSAVGGCLILTAQGGADGCDCDRGAFLSGAWGGGTLSPLPDPCAAVIVRRRLPPGGRVSIRFLLGFAARETAALRYPSLAWKQTAHTMLVPRLRTPDQALDLLCEWLPRQILACRINARTGFYQCGGAWGFRDQLQDSLAALWLDPAVTRRQLMRCAAAQFEEGDVLHWWHALTGAPPRGVRTRCSDDLVWLPFAAVEYADFTGDAGVWEVRVRWLSGPPLAQEEQERYFEPDRTQHADTLYEHCVRALDRAMTAGEHGLPLIGSGDWNDGFNRVGEQGRGESVWLAMFLCMTLERFAPVCARRGDEGRAQRYLAAAQAYRRAADACFDGDRFLRAYLDDGTPLGRADADACALDSLSQSFAVLCGLPPEKTGPALDTALRELIDRRSGVIKLFTPPFDHNERRVGYIASYPSGVRENGGQYTHAAVWLAIALLEAGRADEGVQALHLLNTVAKYEDGRGSLYLGEPYALAGDVYAGRDCPGRVGWTWYTGSAGWYYTAVLRHLFGLRPMGDRLELYPRLPNEWPDCELALTLRSTPLVVHVCRGAPALTVDGIPAQWVPLDGSPHHVEISAGEEPLPQEK